MLWPKKNSCKEFDNEKKFLLLENSLPSPNNFFNDPSLSQWTEFVWAIDYLSITHWISDVIND